MLSGKYQKAKVFLFLLLFFCMPVYAGPLRISFLDVGQGDGALVELPNGKTILVDCGTGPVEDEPFDAGKDVIMPYLTDKKISKIDLLVITHPHYDHYGGALFLLANIKIKEIVAPRYLSTAQEYEKLLKLVFAKKSKYKNLKKGDSINLDKQVLIEVLSPPAGDYFEDANNSSLVLKLTYGETAFLLTGDIEKAAEQLLVKTYADDLGADFIKVPHHGSSTSSTAKFLNAVKPVNALISCGYRNRFGHPQKNVLKRYEALNINVSRTDNEGSLIAESDGKEIILNKLPERILINAE